MRYVEIAEAKPFEGAPKINLAEIFGASPDKPILLKIPVTGKRPITYGAKNLPEGLFLNDGIISGKVKEPGNYTVTLSAKNDLGYHEKKLMIEIRENAVLLTPLLGFTSWNAYGSDVSQEKIEKTAERMIKSGICEYGYSYINTDSGWQKEYGGKFDAILPNEKFPDMKKMCDTIHAYGLKCGIYATPMLTAWGCPKELETIPGCTQGEADELFSNRNTGIGKIRKEKNNVAQWTEWGFDYLKYDWTPCDPYNAELMRQELIKSERDFGFCTTVAARYDYINYWSKYCNSYRNNSDSLGFWDNFMQIYSSYKEYISAMRKGHFFDLDMLDMGTCELFPNGHQFTEDEQIVLYSLRAFMGSPIQISSTLENLNKFELSVYCNEEIIAINQDTAFCPAKPYMMFENGKQRLHIYRRKLSNGKYGIAVFNLGETVENTAIDLEDLSLVRDVWAKKDMGTMERIQVVMHPHTVRIFSVQRENLR